MIVQRSQSCYDKKYPNTFAEYIMKADILTYYNSLKCIVNLIDIAYSVIELI